MMFVYYFSTIIFKLILIAKCRGGKLSTEDFQDKCNYNVDPTYVRCGNKCIDEMFYSSCQCGTQFFSPGQSHQHCCIPSNSTCTKEKQVICSEGKILPWKTHCENSNRYLQCFNSYQDSLQNNVIFSHYTCPNSCIPWADMCQGISWCDNDYEECGPHLRCPVHMDVLERPNWSSGMRVELFKLKSNLLNDHHFCFQYSGKDGYGKINNGKYDMLDRSDESFVRLNELSLDINITIFEKCQQSGNPGFWCGSKCILNDHWCVENPIKYCEYEGFNTNDARLCNNPLLWRNLTCMGYNVYSEGISDFGKRCNGTNQHCIYPWYTRSDLRVGIRMEETCTDKSDQIFTIGLTCKEHLQLNLEFHTQKFCKGTNQELICKNKTEWLSKQKVSLSDPHFCRSSCYEPGPDCMACTDKRYFNCTKSGQCVHPDLVCDGHPQCLEGEDEDLSKCHEKYISNNIVERFASYKCTSAFYEHMEIFATPCNNKTECFDGSDEINCEEGKTTTYVLIGSSIAIILFYLCLKYFNCCDGVEEVALSMIPKEFESMEKYEEKHNDPVAIYDVNIHLLNTILTKRIEVSTNTCKQFYDLESRYH